MEFHGTPSGAQEESAFAEEICRDRGATSFERAESAEDRERIWSARRDAHKAVRYGNPEYQTTITDIVVPLSKYPEMVDEIYRIAARHQIRVGTFGHAGDGNLHAEVLGRLDDPDEIRRANLVVDELVFHALGLGGTCTGEHGIGIGKRKFMRQEHGDSVALMRRIKQLFDPAGILNPGKIFEN
jgi:D-lactate dehydrogenase (cytochrome)